MTRRGQASCALIAGMFWAAGALAQPVVLTPEQWRADLAELVQTVEDNHPDPFFAGNEEAFRAAVAALHDDIEALTDKEIIVRMAQITALLEDGHTRLAFPREYEQLGFSFSHSEPARPHDERLAFRSLPLKFYEFADGMHISEAAPGYEALLGARIIAVDGMPVEEVRARLRTVNYNDNDFTNILLTGDRMNLIEALHALGAARAADSVSLTIERFGEDAESVVEISPLEPGDPRADQFVARNGALWLTDKRTPFWTRDLPDRNALYVKLNEIARPPEIYLGDAMRDALAHAEAMDFGKIVIDLRHNHGGSGGFNRGVVTALLDSPYNRFGKLYVLVGRETFSAAQMLLNELEQYTDALFVGEGSGSTPDQYGDPRRIQLANSGVTLRVSRLYWSSWRAFEPRDGTAPHLIAPLGIDDYMAERDPVLERALAHASPVSLAALVGETIDNGLNWDGARILLSRHLTDHRVLDRDLSRLGEELLAAAGGYETEESFITALFLYDLSRNFLPADRRPYLGWARAALAAGEAGEARNALEQGLNVLPGDPDLTARLNALDAPAE
ncbi:MAG: hypothetical protein Tsb0010_14850 [Parvularculaceae bacterium]